MIYTKDYKSQYCIETVATFRTEDKKNSLESWSRKEKRMINFDVKYDYKNIYLFQKYKEIYNFLSQYENYFDDSYTDLIQSRYKFDQQCRDDFSKYLADVIILRIYYEKKYYKKTNNEFINFKPYPMVNRRIYFTNNKILYCVNINKNLITKSMNFLNLVMDKIKHKSALKIQKCWRNKINYILDPDNLFKNIKFMKFTGILQTYNYMNKIKS
jgi:hypothetical protein